MRSGACPNFVWRHSVDESGNIFIRNRVLLIYERFERFPAQAISSALSEVADLGSLVQECWEAPGMPKALPRLHCNTPIGANPCIANLKKNGLCRLIDKDESPSGESLLLRLDGLDDVTNDEALDALAKCLFDSDDEVSE